MSRPEGLRLEQDEDTLRIVDAQDVPHVLFVFGSGDPTAWSSTIVQATCKALGITEAFSDGEELSIEGTIEYWHAALGAEDGFLP